MRRLSRVRQAYLLLWRGAVEELAYPVHGGGVLCGMLGSQDHLQPRSEYLMCLERIIQVWRVTCGGHVTVVEEVRLAPGTWQ